MLPSSSWALGTAGPAILACTSTIGRLHAVSSVNPMMMTMCLGRSVGWQRAPRSIGRELTRIEERQPLDGEVGVPLPATTGSIDRSSTNHWAGPDDRRMMMESNRIDRSCGDDGRATSCFTDSPDAHLLLLAGRCCYCARFSSVAGLAGDREEKDACVAFA